VSSVDDLQQIEQKNIDLRKVSDNTIDYSKLANQIQRSKRAQAPPHISGVTLSADDEQQPPCLVIQGRNLAVDNSFSPVAVVNKQLAEVLSSSGEELRIQLGEEHALGADNEVILTFDPFALVRLKVRA
jgi:hypothetical protein